MPLPRFLKIFLVTTVIFFSLATASLAAVALYYRDKFYPGVRVAGVQVGGMTESAGKQMIADKAASYAKHPVIVTIPDTTKEPLIETGELQDKEVATTASELGLVLASQEAIDRGWKIGHEKSLFPWLQQSLGAIFTGKNIPLAYQVDTAKTDQFVATKILPQLTAPIAATFIVKGSAIEIIDAKPGQIIDGNELAKKLAETAQLALDGDDATYLRAPVSTQLAAISRQEVLPLVTQLDNLGNTSFSFTAEAVRVVPKREDILTWFTLVQDDAGALALSINETAVSGFLTAKAGKDVDVTKSMTAVVSALEAAEKSADKAIVKTPSSRTALLTLKPKKEITAGSYTLGRFEGKYIEVNIKEQKLYRINGNQLEKVYRISSGKWETPTPIGTFRIAGKHLRPISRKYNLYMPYWQNLLGTADNGDELPLGSYGLHELPERPNGIKEGQRSLGYRASHGCVRLGIGDAAEIYAWTEVGTPVVIY